jgi:hypothetical protein
MQTTVENITDYDNDTRDEEGAGRICNGCYVLLGSGSGVAGSGQHVVLALEKTTATRQHVRKGTDKSNKIHYLL